MERGRRRHTLSDAAATGGSVVSWFVMNMTIANLNKWIFHQYTFRYPGFLTLLHMLACCVCARLALDLCTGSSEPSSKTRAAVRRLSVVFVASVATGNAALKHIHVSFAQAIGATAPLWTVILSVLIVRKRYTLRVYVSLLLVCFGMLLCTTGEVNFNMIGFIMVLFATITRALKSILQGVLLSEGTERLDSISLLYEMSKPAGVLLAVWVLVAEREVLWDPRIRSRNLHDETCPSLKPKPTGFGAEG